MLNFAINKVTALGNQSLPAFTATYTGTAIEAVNINAILAGLTFQTTAASVPGAFEITASGTAPNGYALHFAPGTFTVVNDSPAILPSQTNMIPPLIPTFLPSFGSG